MLYTVTMPDDRLNVNLADPQDIANKLPHAQMILDAKRKIANKATKEYDDWKALVRRLEVVAGVEGPAAAGSEGANKKQAPVQDYAVKIVEREGRPMRPPEVAGMMRAEGFPVKTNNAINSALYVAAKMGKLERPKKGWYAPAGYSDQDNGLLASNGSEAQQ
jgi:hypothetical protein